MLASETIPRLPFVGFRGSLSWHSCWLDWCFPAPSNSFRTCSCIVPGLAFVSLSFCPALPLPFPSCLASLWIFCWLPPRAPMDSRWLLPLRLTFTGCAFWQRTVFFGTREDWLQNPQVISNLHVFRIELLPLRLTFTGCACWHCWQHTFFFP
jgi:hypothetical protein